MPEEDRKVIKKAVYHHSDFHLPDGLSPREQTYCIVDAFHKHELADYSKRVVEQGYLR